MIEASTCGKRDPMVRSGVAGPPQIGGSWQTTVGGVVGVGLGVGVGVGVGLGFELGAGEGAAIVVGGVVIGTHAPATQTSPGPQVTAQGFVSSEHPTLIEKSTMAVIRASVRE